MKRWMTVLLAVLVFVTVGGAGYLGLRSAKGKDSSAIQAPSTVEVTRGDVRTTVTAPGHLVNTQEMTLAFGVGGTLAGVLVQPGQHVVAESVLAQLDVAPLQDRVKAAQADLELARARLEQLQAGPSTVELAAAQLALAGAESRLRELQAGASAAEIAAAETEVAAAQKDLDYLNSLPDPDALAQARAHLDRTAVALQQAQAAYDVVKGRPEVGMLPQALALQQATIDHAAAQASLDAARRKTTPAALRAAQARLAAAEAMLAQRRAGPSADELSVAELHKEKAQAEMAQLAAGPDATELRQAEAAVQAAGQALHRALADVEAATMVAPFDGVVLEVHASAGEMVTAGFRLIRLARCSALEVEATVIEEDLPLVEVGQEVELFFDAQPNAAVQGRVARIVPLRLTGDRPLFPVYVAVGDLPGGLLAGMTADASIVVASRQDVLRLPRALVRARSDGTATVQVWTGMLAQERIVRTGLRGDVYVEILTGLHAGEQVVAQ
jgi:RND family efflux transporter MFP subunit